LAKLALWPALLGLLSCGTPEARRIVFVTLDTTRADRLGCYGYADAETPNLDALAAEGVLFEHAVSAIPTTLPSHATMFTGTYPFDHGVRYNIVFRLGDEAQTLAESLQAAGFATAAFPASYIIARRFGLGQGFDLWSEPPKSDLRHVGSPGTALRPAAEGVDLALEWLEKQRGRKSFVWLHLYDPHAPYAPPFPYGSRFRDRPYDGELAYADAQLGRLFDFLRDDPDWSDTLVIVVGDHGEGLHEHRERFHATLVYETTQHVPLIVRAPGARPRRVDEPVSLVDLMPTVLELARVGVPAGLRGTSLAPALRGRGLPQRDLYFESVAGMLNYGWDELHGIRAGRYKLIDSDDPELFDLEADPAELSNLAGTDADRVADLRAALQELMQSSKEGAEERAFDDPVMDAETLAFLAGLGYVGGSADGSSAADAPQPRDLIDMEAELMAAQGAVATGRWDEVSDLAGYVLARNPTNRWALHNSARAMMVQGDLQGAQDRAKELVENYPEAAESYVTFAQAYRAQERYDTAYDVLEQGLTKNPQSELLHYLLLVTAFDVGFEDVRTERVPRATRDLPGSNRIMVLQARCHARDGDVQSALASLARAVELGFRQVAELEQTEDFANVVEDRGFADLVGIAEQLSTAPAGS
jgi:arylsulfatase A-like enzyme